MSEVVEKGHRAEALLNDPLIVEALSEIEQTLRDQWDDANTTDIREELWYTMKGMQRFTHLLFLTIEQGEYETIISEKENGS